MSAKLQPVRGTHDIFPDESRARNHLAGLWRTIAANYGFGEIQPPMFEQTDVFHRTLGDTSDVVTKETYTFTDRGGDSITLRPEFTAGVVRAFISGGLMNELPLKFFYHGPAFRYERPQKGRLRQFHQLGVEVLGPAEPEADVEVIALAQHCLREIGVAETTTLELNSLGDTQSRADFRAALVKYLGEHRAALSPESQARLDRNPLRVLDSKDEADRKICANAPILSEYYTMEAAQFFAALREGLDNLGIAYTVNPRLVRGLDYYNHTVFEFTTTRLGAQGTVLAGGRYDGLVSLMGGPETPGVGWAAGVERLLELAAGNGFAAPPAPRPVAVVPVGDSCAQAAWKLANTLRQSGIAADVAFRGNVGKRMKRADKLGAPAAVMLGEDELASQTATVKILATGEQKTVAISALIPELRALL